MTKCEYEITCMIFTGQCVEHKCMKGWRCCFNCCGCDIKTSAMLTNLTCKAGKTDKDLRCFNEGLHEPLR